MGRAFALVTLAGFGSLQGTTLYRIGESNQGRLMGL